MKKSAVFFAVLAFAFAANAKPLKLEVPPAQLMGTPVPIKINNLEEKASKAAVLDVPEGVKNVASGKKVTSSDDFPIIGDLECITDGDKEAGEGSYVQLAEGKQWVQIDLEKSSEIFAIAVWHYHSQERVYKDVVIQLSDDPEFLKGVTTVFNNDDDNSSKFGKGANKNYIETNYGKAISLEKPVKARYVRLYSAGNTTDDMNHYIEVEVFGR